MLQTKVQAHLSSRKLCVGFIDESDRVYIEIHITRISALLDGVISHKYVL